MEQKQQRFSIGYVVARQAYNVLAFTREGKTAVFAAH